uniref:Ankyrin repeat-containing domain n=1 Tax=Peronospora matthiolae TaxID=2874970 RepID=A0AAV1U1T6_9STRA
MVLTAARLVCTNRDRVSELAHVWGAMDQFLDYSNGWTLERAAAKGFKFLVQRLALKVSAGSPNPNNKLLVMDFAAGNGHLDILKWLHNTEPLNGCSTRAMDDAAKNGHYEVVQWLHVNRSEGCTSKAMDYAACNGHLSMVQWLHEHRTEGMTTRAMDLAAQSGHLHVLQWLQDNRSAGCTPSAVNYAATEGHLHIVRWLCDIRKEMCSPSAMINAARRGHLSIIKYLSARFHTLFASVGSKMVLVAIANGQAAVLVWLTSVLPVKSLKCEEDAESWMDVASTYGQVDILKWFHDHAAVLSTGVDKRTTCTAAAVTNAARSGHYDVLVYLHANDLMNLTDESDATDALVAAVEGGHHDCTEWLVAQFRTVYEKDPCTMTTVMDAGAASGHVGILQLLRDNPSTSKWQTSSKAIDRAARYGFIDVLRWLHVNCSTQGEENSSPQKEPNQTDSHWTPIALELAVTNGHLQVVQYLIEHHRFVCSGFEAFNAACYMDHLEVAQYLYSNVRSLCSVKQALEQADEGGAEDTLTWLQGLLI